MSRFLQTLLLCLFGSSLALAQSTNFMKMVYVEGGTFNMGGSDDESNSDEKPVHKVTLRSFYMGQYEVTVAQYRSYCRETGVSMPAAPSWGWRDNDPIVNVNWNEAKDFADWLSEKTDRTYRLPTEAQWEYAARGGRRSQGKTYAGSNSLELVGWFEGNSGNQTHPVGQKKPNELGIYDLSGNAWEWCRDWYDPDYYSKSPATNPVNQTALTDRVLRGGSWYFASRPCRSANRSDNTPKARSGLIGFRLVSQ